MKTKQEIQEWIIPLYKLVCDPLADLMNVIDVDINFKKNRKDNNFSIPKISNFYAFFDWLKIKWKSKPDNEIKYEGSINFIPLEQVLYN